MAEKQERLRFWQKLFPPHRDFYGLLLRHAERVHEGVKTFHRFLEQGQAEDGERVRVLEKEADELRRELRNELFEAFSTPIDREDLFYLSRRLDEIINYAKHALRDMQILEVKTSPTIVAMAEILEQGSHHIVEAIRLLPTRNQECGHHARAAKNCENDVTKLYPRGLKALYDQSDLKEILKQQEVLRNITFIANRIDEAADVILQITIKES